MLSLGLLSKRYRTCHGQPLLAWGLWTFERYYEIPQYELRQTTYKDNLLEVAWLGVRVRWGKDSPGQATTLARLMESADLAPTCAWMGGTHHKGAMASPRESCLNPRPSSPCPEASQFSPPHISPVVFKLLSYTEA